MVLVLLASTLIYPFAMFVFPWHLGTLDWGPVWAGYLGSAFFTFAAVGIGMMYSSLTESDVVAFFMTAATFALLYAMSALAAAFPGTWFADSVDFISLPNRMLTFTRGVIDTRSLVFFASIAILCVLISFRSLESRKWS